jgi:hypothetical protein
MPDPLFARAQLAIEESHRLQYQRDALRTRRDLQRGELRRAVFESAMMRSEINACRDDKYSFVYQFAHAAVVVLASEKELHGTC